jgi:hypothetical protein
MQIVPPVREVVEGLDQWVGLQVGRQMVREVVGIHGSTAIRTVLEEQAAV